jgi:hypothetical protein
MQKEYLETNQQQQKITITDSPSHSHKKKYNITGPGIPDITGTCILNSVFMVMCGDITGHITQYPRKYHRWFR